MSIREVIAKRRIVEVKIDFPEIPTVRVRRLSLADMLAIEQIKDTDVNATIVLRTIIDDDGSPVFSDLADVTADWRLFQAMLQATASVNDLQLKVKQAEKN